MRFVLAFLIIMMPGCASTPARFLSAEEDADMRAKCEKSNCVVIPGYLWEQIKGVLQRALGTAI